ncbi:biliverdin-producing heme oxygenase [Actinoplanes sp. KI2]|uniref:biliverdin-producing heme oxygenase n=1 Tax=Actinoplanes sp. KI2 TaxID=2983315 RepID=UPI0021D59019|nr:biliverdin-producing heme oxygenase [Actinoplanes sp. KI2]MCU7723164.1 biliverdin-producing heme oxygenase [Actinoplanes sp. KI2]
MSFMADPPGADRLSARLRRETGRALEITQTHSFLDALAAGRVSWVAYADMVAQYWFLYEALELAGHTMADDPIARAFVFPELERLAPIEADLRFLHGPRWADRMAALPATTTYCTRLRYAANSHPVGFIAHHYTRFLGDLAGGQYLGQAIARVYGLNGAGHRFYVFPGIDLEAFQTYYGRLLDALPGSSEERDELVAEAVEAHRLHLAVLDELARRWI